jgi:hypothetical protein
MDSCLVVKGWSNLNNGDVLSKSFQGHRCLACCPGRFLSRTARSRTHDEVGIACRLDKIFRVDGMITYGGAKMRPDRADWRKLLRNMHRVRLREPWDLFGGHASRLFSPIFQTHAPDCLGADLNPGDRQESNGLDRANRGREKLRRNVKTLICGGNQNSYTTSDAIGRSGLS